MMDAAAKAQQVKALLDERKGYVARNLPERIAGVDAALARLGFPQSGAVPETTALEAPTEKAIPPRPQPRRREPDAR